MRFLNCGSQRERLVIVGLVFAALCGICNSYETFVWTQEAFVTTTHYLWRLWLEVMLVVRASGRERLTIMRAVMQEMRIMRYQEGYTANNSLVLIVLDSVTC